MRNDAEHFTDGAERATAFLAVKWENQLLH